MNKAQTKIIFLAAVAFVISILAAPWRMESRPIADNAIHINYVNGPMFMTPENGSGRANLEIGILLMEWAAICVLAGAAIASFSCPTSGLHLTRNVGTTGTIDKNRGSEVPSIKSGD